MNCAVRLIHERIPQLADLKQAYAQADVDQHPVAVFFLNLVCHGLGPGLVELARGDRDRIPHAHQNKHISAHFPGIAPDPGSWPHSSYTLPSSSRPRSCGR